MKLILLDRGDRKPLTDWVKGRFKDYDIICPDFEPASNDKDIVARLRAGLAQAKDEDFVYILENDDYYPLDYIDRMEAARHEHQAHWIGDCSPTYYNVGKRTYQKFDMGTSGLWCMGFDPKIMTRMVWLNDAHVSMDGWITRKVRNISWARTLDFQDHGGIGIKGHGQGLAGSGGHKMILDQQDPDLTWLKAHTDKSFIDLHFKTTKHEEAI